MKKIALDYFKLSKAEVEHIIHDSKERAFEQNLELLIRWRNKNSENARQVINIKEQNYTASFCVNSFLQQNEDLMFVLLFIFQGT